MKVIKLIWLADRYHLRKYGRPVIGDNYIAMKYGPVPSSVRDIMKSSDFLDEREAQYSAQYISPIGRYIIKSLQSPDLDVFSDSDIESLEFAFSKFGGLNEYKLSEVSHAYPEWKKFEAALLSGQSTRENMDYVDFFNNPQTSTQDPFSLDSEVLNSSKDEYLESSAINKSLT